jgi:hypothetical protein
MISENWTRGWLMALNQAVLAAAWKFAMVFGRDGKLCDYVKGQTL